MCISKLMERWIMKYLLIPLVLLPCSVLAQVPDFQCWDIKDSTFSTDGGVYATRYVDKNNTSYVFITAPNDEQYIELNISTTSYKEFYYGNRYYGKDGRIYDDIKCKRK